MDFLLRKGTPFQEEFNFKGDKNRPIPLPPGTYKIILERGSFAREYTVGNGLSKQRSTLVWRISAEENSNFEFTTLYYTLYIDDNELSRGVVKVQ